MNLTVSHSAGVRERNSTARHVEHGTATIIYINHNRTSPNLESHVKPKKEDIEVVFTH